MLADWNWAGHQGQEWEGKTVETEDDGVLLWILRDKFGKQPATIKIVDPSTVCQDFARFSFPWTCENNSNMLQDAPETLLAQADGFWWVGFFHTQNGPELFFHTENTKHWKHFFSSGPTKTLIICCKYGMIILPSYLMGYLESQAMK